MPQYVPYILSLCYFMFIFNISYANVLTEGGYYIGKTDPKNTVIYQESPILVNDEGYFFIGFHHRENHLEQTYSIISPDGTTQQKQLTLTKRLYDIQKIYGIEQKYVTPPPERLQRIQNESKLVKEKRSIYSKNSYYLQNFIMPIQGTITGVFGSQRFYNDKPRTPHYGIDIASPQGTPIKAPNHGMILLAKDLYYSGLTIMIDHGHGVMSTLLHLHSMNVKEGDYVQQGQIIGTVGSTGRSTGPHLDWRINWQDKRLDAMYFIPQ